MWQEFLDVFLEWNALTLGSMVLLIVIFGSGVSRSKLPRLLWATLLMAVGVSLYFGVTRHEWGEVLFNGQLL